MSTLVAAYSVWLAIFQKDKNILVIATKLSVAQNFIIKVKTMIKRGDKVDAILKLLNNKRYKIKNLILGLALEGNDTNKIINSLTGSFRKKLNLPITIVPDNYNNYVFKNRRDA